MDIKEAVTKSTHSASFLVSDLQQAHKRSDPILSMLLLDLLESARKIQQRLNEIDTLCGMTSDAGKQ